MNVLSKTRLISRSTLMLLIPSRYEDLLSLTSSRPGRKRRQSPRASSRRSDPQPPAGPGARSGEHTSGCSWCAVEDRKGRRDAAWRLQLTAPFRGVVPLLNSPRPTRGIMTDAASLMNFPPRNRAAGTALVKIKISSFLVAPIYRDPSNLPTRVLINARDLSLNCVPRKRPFPPWLVGVAVLSNVSLRMLDAGISMQSRSRLNVALTLLPRALLSERGDLPLAGSEIDGI